jgi:hypothetical protein
MSLPHKAEPHDDVAPAYYFRRRMGAHELLPAVGAGVGVGLIAFYIARLYLQRTPLVPSPRASRGRVAAQSVVAAEGDDAD